MSLGEQPLPGVSSPMAKKEGLRQRLSHFFSRSEMNLQELQTLGSEGGRPRLMGSRDPLHECHPGRRRKRPKKQKATQGASVEDICSVPMKQATEESPHSSRSQKPASKARALSYSESDLWQNSLRKFGSLAWWKQRRHHLQLSGNPPSNPRPLGRLQRPAVGSDADMRMRSDSGKDGNDTGKLERSKPSSQVPEDSSRSSLVPSTSLDSLLRWGDESSWEESFSLSNSSLPCLTAHEKKMEALKLLSGQEQNHTSLLPLSTWAHWALDGYLTSGGSRLTVVGEPKNYSSDFGESVSQQNLEESKSITSLQTVHSLKVPDVVQTSQADKAPKIRYEVRLTLTRKEEEKVEDGVIEGEATEGSGKKGLLCHPSEEEILSLQVAELEKKEERHHHKPAQPAPGLSARKEFQNCTGLHWVGTCTVCGVTQNPATRNLAVTALLCKSETNPEEGKDPRGIDPLSSGDDTLAEGTECVASETSASRTRGIPLAAQNKSPERPFEIETGPFHPQRSMEKITSRFQPCLNGAGEAPASASLKWKKLPPEPSIEEVKSPVGKTATTRSRERAQTSSPSRVSLLLEAWEKGLVGMDTSNSSSSPAEGRRSRSPGHSRRLRSDNDSLFPSAAGSSPSPLKKRSHSPTDARHAFSPGVSRQSCSPSDSFRAHSPANSKRSPSPSTNRHSFPSDPVLQLLSPLNARRSCFIPGAPHLSSLASVQNAAENPCSSSTAEKHHSSSPVDTEYSSPSPETNGLPSVADIRRLYASRDSRDASSPASTKRPFPSEESRCFSSSDTKHLADTKHLSSARDAKPSSFLEKSRSCSPTSTGRCSPSRSSPRDFKTHRPVFAQVYSPVLKPKSQGRTEIQEDHGGMKATSPKENHSCDTAEACLATGLHGDIPCTDRSETESYSSRTADVPLSCGESYMPSALKTNPDASRDASPKPHVCSTTIARSQTQWYGSDRSSVVVFRSEQQVIVPQDGTATVYTTGREVIMSSSGVGSMNKAQPETSPLSNSTNCVPSKENQQSKMDLPEVKSTKGFLSSLSDADSYSQVTQPESCTIQSKSANSSDTQRQRCMFVPIRNEGVVPFRNPERESSLHGETAFQKHNSLFPENRSQKEQSTSLPGGPVANGPEEDNCLSRAEKACRSGSWGIWSSSKAVRDSSKFKTFAGSQEIAPSDEEITCQSKRRDEQQGPRKDCQMSAAESNFPLADTTSSSQEPLSQKTEGSNRMVELEPEEVVDMDLLVDTLRNMDPADPRKPLKLFTRPPRPSALAKHTPLPPIHEDQVAPKSQVPLPAALGELFTLAEEKNTQEGEEPKKEDTAIAEDTMEEIKNPYPSKDFNMQDKKQTTKFYPWENMTFKTEEEIGSFLGKLHHPDSRCIAPKATANHNNTIRANIFKGVSLLSTFSDRKLVEENRPYSRLDNSLLYSRFISPEMTQHRDPAKGKDMRMPLTFLNTPSAKINKEGQASANGPWLEGTYQGRSCEALPSGQPDPSSKVTGASRSSTLVKKAKSASQPDVQLQELKKPPKKINMRPGKIILFSELGFGGQKREIWGDVTDGTPWLLSHTISVQVIRGGWVMYEKPRFHGRKCVLAEGDVEISNPWAIYHKEGEGTEPAPFRIGSLKRVVHDYRIPDISLFSEENGEGTKQRFTDSSEDTRTHGQPLQAASIIVHSGLWLIYSKPFFDDDPYVLEPGGYPCLQAWGAKSPCICSMHPIKLGSPVVEKPGEPKALIYEKPHFQGCSWEVSRDIYDLKKPEDNQDCKMLTAGSLRITGGCWVGYEKEGFRGHQYLLEEGEYNDWTQWGGYNEELVSLRLIRTDFLDPALVLFEATDFEEGPSIELNEALPDVELASYGLTTQSIHVVSGVWVAYEGKNFTGEQYILEKGVYRNCEDWGANNCQISSVQPILQVGEHSLHFISKIQLFSGPDFLGSHISFEEDQASIPEHLIPSSCRVNGGSWILYDGQWFEGEQHILSEGEYPTLTSMGCLFTTAIRSLRKVPIFFSEPSIFLHGLEFFEGKEIELNGEVRSLQAEGFNNHVLSVRVKGGIWVLCEHSDFRGRQWLLECMEITNWLTYSGIQHIGSLYPIRQKRIYFRIKNEELKSFLSVPDDVEDMKAGRVLVSELSDKSSSIWYYEEGLLKNQVAPFMSLQVIGPAGKGSKVVLWSESRVPRQSWRIDSFGKICSQMFEDKVLDVKGGISYDKDHAILWDSAEERPTQIWDIQVL